MNEHTCNECKNIENEVCRFKKYAGKGIQACGGLKFEPVDKTKQLEGKIKL